MPDLCSYCNKNPATLEAMGWEEEYFCCEGCAPGKRVRSLNAYGSPWETRPPAEDKNG